MFLIALLCAIISVFGLLTRFAIELGIRTNQWDNEEGPGQLNFFFTLCITMLITFSPELKVGFWNSVISLYTNKLMMDNCLLRKLNVVESMGEVDYICTDVPKLQEMNAIKNRQRILLVTENSKEAAE